MARFKSIHVALPVRDVKRTAAFFTEFLGFQVVEEGIQRVMVGQGDLRLTLMKAEPRTSSVPSPFYIQLLVNSPWEVDELAERAQRLGIPLLQETVAEPGGKRFFVCLGPDDVMIEIAHEPERPAALAPESRMEHRVPSSSVPPTPSDAPPSIAPTRDRDYLLLAKERLAKIKEELARLSVGFSHEDIATILEEMREKVARRSQQAAERIAQSIEREPSPQPSRSSIEETLARYKQLIQRPSEPEAPAAEDGLKPVRKTLAPAPDQPPPGRRDE
ncbi:MAG: VOC family protein [Acidobacteria bacterium]|nr:MAG: VOC family protein [Acidobacteriota bacterium]